MCRVGDDAVMGFNRLKARISMTAVIGAVLLAMAGMCAGAGAAAQSGEVQFADTLSTHCK